MNDLAARVARLEKTNKRLRLGFLASVVIVAACCFAGAKRGDVVPEVINAHGFCVVDDKGEPRAMLSMVPKRDEVKLILRTADKGQAACLAADGNEARVWVTTEDGNNGCFMRFNEDEPVFFTLDKEEIRFDSRDAVLQN